MEDRGVGALSRVSHATLSASWAAVAGRRKACATSSRRGGTGRGNVWVGVLLCHECLKAGTPISDGHDGTRCGIWPRDGRSPLGPISGHLSFRLRVAVTVQFGHQDGGLGVCAGAGGGVARCGAHTLGVSSTKTMLEKDLESSAHGATLSKRERPYDKVRRCRGVRNRDYAARPFTTGRIRTVILVCLPQSEGEGLQGGLWGGVRNVV